MLYCQNCGSICEDTDLICKTCGVLLARPSAASGNPPQVPPDAQAKRPYTENTNPYYQQGPSPNGYQAYGPTPGGPYQAPGGMYGGTNGRPNGYSPQYPVYSYYTTGPKNNGFAVASLVLGIVGIVMFFCDLIGFFPAVLAIIFGFVSKSAIRKSNGTEGGRGMATAGLVMGIVSVVFTILVIAALVIFTLTGIFTFGNSVNSYGFPSGQGL